MYVLPSLSDAMLHANGSGVVRMRRVRGESLMAPSLETCVPLKSPRRKSTGVFCIQRSEGRVKLVPLSAGVGEGEGDNEGVGTIGGVGVGVADAIGVASGTLGVGLTISEAEGAIGFSGSAMLASLANRVDVEASIKPPRRALANIEYSMFAKEFKCKRDLSNFDLSNFDLSNFDLSNCVLSDCAFCCHAPKPVALVVAGTNVDGKSDFSDGGNEANGCAPKADAPNDRADSSSKVLLDSTLGAMVVGVVADGEVPLSTLLLAASGDVRSLFLRLSTAIAKSCKPDNEYSMRCVFICVSLKAAMLAEPRSKREKLAGGDGTRLLSTIKKVLGVET